MSALPPNFDQDPQEHDEPADAGASPKDPYGFAIAVITLLVTCAVALVVSLHALR